MEGGCLNIWLQKPLTLQEQDLIKKYSVFINSFSIGYVIKLRDLKIRSHSQRKQIYGAIGYIPTYEILVCGFVDDLFLSAETILKELNGFLNINFSAPEKDINEATGQCYRIKNTRVEYFLMDWEYTACIFNKRDPLGKKEIYSLKRFKKNKFLHLNIN